MLYSLFSVVDLTRYMVNNFLSSQAALSLLSINKYFRTFLRDNSALRVTTKKIDITQNSSTSSKKIAFVKDHEIAKFTLKIGTKEELVNFIQFLENLASPAKEGYLKKVEGISLCFNIDDSRTFLS